MTAREKVLKRYPKAIAKYVGLTMKIVIAHGLNTELSGHYLRERDAWNSAAKRLATQPR